MSPKRKLQTNVGKDEDDSHQENEHDEEIKRKRKKLPDEKKSCSQCKVVYGMDSFSKRQWKERSSRCKSCIQTQASPVEKICRSCNVTLGKDAFSNSQRKGSAGTNVCKACVEKVRHCKICQTCQKDLPKKSFSPSQWKGPVQKTTRSCKACCAMNAEQNNLGKNEKLCNRCEVSLGKDSFSTQEWKGSTEKTRCCKSCGDDVSKKEERACLRCKIYLCKDSFSNSQWKGGQKRMRTCKPCVREEKPKSRKQIVGEMENDANLVNANPESGSENQMKPKAGEKMDTKKEKQQSFETDTAVIKRKLTERVNILPQNRERKSFQFQWESSPVSQKDENNMAARVVVKGRYGLITDKEKDNLSNYIQNTSTAMSVAQAISLRSVLLQQKAMFRHVHIQRNSKTLHKKYKAGESIIGLSRFVDCPPMNVFRMILAMMDYGKARIKRCLRDPKKELELREQREFAEAESADSVSNVNQDSTRAFADAFEDIVASFLVEKGVAFVRQKELETEQKKIFGKSILTPDFLFLDEVEINGQRVTWIDAKAFYGANIHFNISKIKKQMSRYIDHWGGGAIMYLQGFSEKLVMDGCTMLNARDVMSAEVLLPLEHKIASSLE